MDRSTLALVGGVVVVIAAVGGGAVALGLVPGTGGTDASGSPPTVAEPDSSTNDSAAASESEPFTYEITNLTECGQTCRVMESELTNELNESASNVTLAYEVYAGGDSTVWEGQASVGTLDANASTSLSTRIEVGIQEGIQIRNNDGDVTIITTVYADGEQRAQFRDQDNVE